MHVMHPEHPYDAGTADTGTADAEPADTPYADLHETHSGVVLLLGPTAYKLKKPVRLPFLDFSTPEARAEACRRELDLNRRLAPDVYLGLTSLGRPDGGSEPVVMMRRMPDHRRLSQLVVDGRVQETHIRALARLIAAFHARADRGDDISAAGRRDRVALRWQHNLDEALALRHRALPEDTVAAVRRWSGRYLAGRQLLFDERIAAGRVVDAHGDLLADDIYCLDDGPRVLDCLEFDDALRWMDQVDDVACLAMDLERLGRADLGMQLIADYRRFGADDAPESLAHHYLAYRAFMRAKVECVRAGQDGTPRARAGQVLADDPEVLVRLALLHLRRAAVRLILVGGAPGTGKTTLSDALAARLGASVLSSDRVRKELAGVDPLVSAQAGFEEGIYAPAWTIRTYAELIRRAETLLCRGQSVILDASWTSAGHRAIAVRLAEESSADLYQLRCELPAAVAAQRILHRREMTPALTPPGGAADAGVVSDADEKVAEAIRELQRPWPDSVRVDTMLDPDAVTETALSAVGSAPST